MQRAQEAHGVGRRASGPQTLRQLPEWGIRSAATSSIFAVVMGWKPPESIASYDADGDSDGGDEADEL